MAKSDKPDPCRPCVTLLAKLGSIVVHAEELVGPNGHDFDRLAIMSASADPEVKAWIEAMGPLLPLKRSKP